MGISAWGFTEGWVEVEVEVEVAVEPEGRASDPPEPDAEVGGVGAD